MRREVRDAPLRPSHTWSGMSAAHPGGESGSEKTGRPAAARGTSSRSPVLLFAVYRDAARVFHRNLPRIALLGVILYGAATVVETALNQWLNRLQGVSIPQLVAAMITTILVGGTTAVYATLLFAGLLDYTIEAELEGRRVPPLTQVLRRTPYLRLLVLDALVVLVTAIGVLLLVIPGLIAFTLLSLASPLAVSENLGPVAAMRRSIELVRPRFGTAVAVFLLPELVASTVSGGLEERASRLGAWAGVVTGVVLQASLLAFVALLLGVLAHHLQPGKTADED
jgi:hypothetical protein